LQVTNNSLKAGATGLSLNVAQRPPLVTNSSVTATGLRADTLDGIDSTQFLQKTSLESLSAVIPPGTQTQTSAGSSLLVALACPSFPAIDISLKNTGSSPARISLLGFGGDDGQGQFGPIPAGFQLTVTMHVLSEMQVLWSEGSETINLTISNVTPDTVDSSCYANGTATRTT
jgi:hypothetical protein